MGREKRTTGHLAARGDHAKARHQRDRKGNIMDWTAPLPAGLKAKPDRPQCSSKHKSWFEFIENKDKKKKLEIEFTESREPPPGFEFVPIGNPTLTSACKELSREHGAMIFIVTSSNGQFSKELSRHLNRVGIHVRESIVDQARQQLGQDSELPTPDTGAGQPEPIPEKQEDINKQADAAIRDLFPRIPNTDRQMILEHSFNKTRLKDKKDPPVGLAAHVTLSRRVQLAVLAHIRHNHTRYDKLLRETSYVNARKAVEGLCLDYLVKWRGDEETGRDQLDEILAEVVVISDSESEDEDEDDDDDDDEDQSSDASSVEEVSPDKQTAPVRSTLPTSAPKPSPPAVDLTQPSHVQSGPAISRRATKRKKAKKEARKERLAAKRAERGFNRYRAVDQAWSQAIERQRLGNVEHVPSPTATDGIDRSVDRVPQPWQPSGHENIRPTDQGIYYTREPLQPARYVYENVSQQSGPPYSSVQRPTFDESAPRVGDPNLYRGQDWPVQRLPLRNSSRPIVGPQAASHAGAVVERVRHHGEDLRDYLVPSVEERSPDVAKFPSEFPSQDYRSPREAHNDMPSRQVHYTLNTREEFITLPPRSEGIRTATAPAARPESYIVVSSQPRGMARAYAPVAGTGNPHDMPSYRDDARRLDYGQPARADTQSWIREDNAYPRSEARPIVIHDSPGPVRHESVVPARYPQDARPPPPPRREHEDVNQSGAIYVGDRDRWRSDSRNGQYVEDQLGDFAEIVRVSNKFPKRHGSQPVPVDAELYDSPSTPSRPQDYGYVYREGERIYDSQSGHTTYPRTERVVGRYQQSVDHRSEEVVSGIKRHADGYPSGSVKRQERVLGIETDGHFQPVATYIPLDHDYRYHGQPQATHAPLRTPIYAPVSTYPPHH
ncbi:unnamed protein product [Sordaria macrospora k-hell]|uniref:WGS project CABT00000000 data, contig 2.3 n=1 Tax=Sordaria macrospora (strain ATCC MYA-333 / DSM 997 / K(L3346) / K-hell) TaxID=771870 RepID=F7VPU5_SORMK|nr:uncharacterized protein SMAC_06725 [Sordaria macrospora k-hell]KAH7627107.1 hypothetical protein B0T09DRAFT_39745 [Sordaria sp. MPI-SDFR-AT-0083]CCC07523.1 unnamed protein product [Sordaria macrospora k-hell]